MDDIDRQLLILLQREVPIHRRPFELIGQILGIHSADVILRLHHLRDENLIKRIGPIFDTDKLGYKKATVFFQVPPENLEKAGDLAGEHPGVISCASWEGSFNLWFTLSLPPQESIEIHTRLLREVTGAAQSFRARTLQIYKGRNREYLRSLGKKVSNISGELTELETDLLRTLEEEFPLTDDPYQRIARNVGTTEEFVIKQLLFFQKNGLLKKINAETFERRPSVSPICVMWEIPDEKINFAAAKITERREVVFCVKRAVSSELPFNLHATVEGLATEEVLSWAKAVEQQIGSWPRQVYLHQKDYKKNQPKYFAREIEKWRMANQAILPFLN